VILGALFLGAALLCGAAGAQDYPAKPVRLIVGYPPGGATDLVARILQPRLTQSLQREIIVDNRPGAGGVIGADLAAKSAPDGYTLHLATHAALVIAPLIGTVPYDPFRDFTPVARLVELPNIFIVRPAVPVHSMEELLALAKAKPGQLNYASPGLGSAGHLAGELLQRMAGIDWVHVPYKGGSAAMTDFLAGHVEVFIAIVSTTVPYVRQGKARALAVTGSKRAAALPEVPTVAEAGVPGFESTNWYGLVGPAGLPRPIVERLNRDVVAVLAVPEVRQALIDRGIDPAPSTPDELAAEMHREFAKWTAIIKAAGLQGAAGR